MEKLVKAKDIQSRYGCSLPTARKYIRQMFHYEKPLAAPRWAFDEWEKSREYMPSGFQPEIITKQNRTIVPRKRANNERKT